MSLKRTRRDCDGRVIILPSTTAEEHLAVQRESKARTTLLQSIPDDHIADFHYIDDARDIWNVDKARFGGNVESKKMRKSMPKQKDDKARFGGNAESKKMRKSMELISLQRSTQMTLPLVILVLNLHSPSKMILPPVHQLPVIEKVNIPPARPQPVPTGKPNVFVPVPTGRPNRPYSVPTDRGYSPSVVLGKHKEKVFTGYPRTMVDLIHLHTDDNVANLLTKALHRPRYVVSTGRVIVPTSRYIVPTGRVIVATDRYIVPADISLYKQGSLLYLACDYTSYSPPLTGSKDLSRVGSIRGFTLCHQNLGLKTGLGSHTHGTYSPRFESFFPAQGICYNICLAQMVFDFAFVVTE
nr:xylulose kinase-1 [Tanacetum cinerariifolium]